MTDEENKKIIERIEFEEKWLINVKTENGFVSIPDIKLAMSGIRSVIAELERREQMSKIYGIGDEEELAEDLQKELPNRIIAELEQIKTEIKQINLDLCNFPQSVVFEILDKHIKENKQ